MHFPALFDAIGELDIEDYRKIGVAGNPAPSGLRRLEGELEERVRRIHVSCEPLESELKERIDQFRETEMLQPSYLLFRRDDFGARHTFEILMDYCRDMDLPFMELNRDDIEEAGIEAIQYLIALAGAEKVVMFCEPFWEESDFYRRLLEFDYLYLIGRGSEPERELTGVEEQFHIFDLEDYPFSEEQIYEILRSYLKAVRLREEIPVSEEHLKAISHTTQAPGEALNILGVCLAVAAYRQKLDKKPQITDADLEGCSNRRVVEWIAHH